MKNRANTPDSTPMFNHATSAEEESIDLAQYWHVIKRHKLGIINITVVCLIIGVLVALSSTPIYKAETKLVADPMQPNLDTRDQYVNTALVFLFYETQYEIIRSQRIAQKAVDKLNLVERHRAGELGKPDSEHSLAFIQTLKEFDLAQQIKDWLPLDKQEESAPDTSDHTLRIQLAGKIQAGLTVEGGKQSEIINISYEDSNPKLAAEITNAIAESYVEYGLESRSSGAKETSIAKSVIESLS